jgi:predicted DCC family thiol-disulfide oxidoreductase YuxK
MSFIPASGSDSEQLLGELGIPRELCEKSVILIQDRHVFSKSTAVIKAIQSKGRGWKIAGLLTIVPLFIRDALYDWIAGNRKRKRHEFL